MLIRAFIGNTVREALINCYGRLEYHHNQRVYVNALPLVILALTLLSLCNDADCNTQEIISSDLRTCESETMQDGSRSCQFYSTAKITLPTILSESCLWFTDKHKNHLFSLKIKLGAVKCDFSTERQYFTFPVTVKHISQVSCIFHEFCGQGCHYISRHIDNS